MPIKKSISVIIPNYNGAGLLGTYLPHTLRALAHAEVEYEVIIVDDCSRDNSVDFIRSTYPGLTLVVNASNRGFSYTCNQGIRLASMELVMLLNTDVSLTADYFERLWGYFDEEDTFGVMGRIMNMNGKIEDAARFLSFSGMKFKATDFYYSMDKDLRTPTAYLSGANAVVSREKLMELKGFDEIYSPFYCEDVDLSFRAWRLGWKCYYDHWAVCHHEVSTTTKKMNSKKALLPVIYRNKFILQAIHLDGGALVLWYIQLIFVEVLLRVLTGKLWVLKALKGFFGNRKAIQESRSTLHKLMDTKPSPLSLKQVSALYFKPVRSWKTEKI